MYFCPDCEGLGPIEACEPCHIRHLKEVNTTLRDAFLTAWRLIEAMEDGSGRLEVALCRQAALRWKKKALSL